MIREAVHGVLLRAERSVRVLAAALALLVPSMVSAQYARRPPEDLLTIADHILSCGRIANAGTIGRLRSQAQDFSPLAPIPHSALPGGLLARRSASEDLAFVEYLVSKDLRTEAAAFSFADNLHFPSDTLDYMKAWSAYSLRQLDTASTYFPRLGASAFADKAHFYNVACLAHLGRFGEALELSRSYVPCASAGGQSAPPAELLAEMKAVQEAGLCLLAGRPEDFAASASAFTGTWLAEYEANLEKACSEILGAKRKSPAAAALMSAVIPGSGKMYAGNVAEGVSALLIVGGMAGITAESWVRHGIRDWRTIVLASLTGILHVGNIYGSYVSVSLTEQVIDNARKTAVLFDIHVPLHTLFR